MLSLPLSSSVFSGYRISNYRNPSIAHVSVSLDIGARRATSAEYDLASVGLEETRERIVKLIREAELSVSPYDTAWVAMVPSLHSSSEPYFRDCVNWLLENQCTDGSWARPHHNQKLLKDVLSSTLACVLALKKWGVGQEQINKAVHFIELNFASAIDKDQSSPLGFEIIFPGMLEYARDLHLNLHLEPMILTELIQKRGLELTRYSQRPSSMQYLAYFAEGLNSKLQNWESVLKYQRKNGSLFNTPSTTAAAYINLKNTKCLSYLKSALNKFGNAVPAIYPLDIYCRLSTIDNLEKLGISSYFKDEIQSVLDEIYGYWLQGDKEIFTDASTCALAFRVLRINGYDVTSGSVIEFLQEDGDVKDIHTSLELYKASEVLLFPNESEMQKQNLRLKKMLEEELSMGFVKSGWFHRNIDHEVNRLLEHPFYAILERVANRRNLEHYQFDSTRMHKTSYCSPNWGNKDFFFISATDFNRCQKIHQEELKQLERWVIENKLDELKFARSKAAYCYFSTAGTLFSPELSDARMSWAKNGVLTTVVDDFFDVGGSVEELKNLIQLIEAWDVDVSKECSSQNVQIIFSALRRNICEIGDKALVRQGRNVTNHVIQIWLDLLNSMMKEHEWVRDEYLPTMDEYMSNAYVSFALGPIVLPALYLVGPKVTEEMIHHPEYHNLFKLMSTCGRLLNDMRTYEREMKDGKLNAVSLYMINNSGCRITKEDAVTEMKGSIERQRRELLRLVLDGRKGSSIIPKPCKDLFWHMCTVVHLFYSKDDGFTSQEMIKVVNEIIHQPIVIKEI